MTVLTLPEVKTHLNLTSTRHDDELTEFIGRAEAAVSQRVGPLESTEVTERVDGRGTSLVLSQAPALSLTSVAPAGGEPLDTSGLRLDRAAGTVEHDGGGGWFPAARYDVTYTAGRATVPADLRLATLELLRHLWATQRGNAPTSAGALPNAGETEVLSPAETGAAFSYPWRVEQLLAPHLKVTF